jgi:RHS repeat-associated protein
MQLWGKPGGDIVWSAAYDAHGRVQKLLVDEIAQPLRFQGQYFDEETRLCYNRHRYFDPATCSFISQDPIGLAGGENVYAYAPNVWGWVDPLGLCKKSSGPGWYCKAPPGAPKTGDELVDLYRSVGVREYESIMQNKAFLPGGNSLEGRQFAKTLDEALNYADTDLSKVAVIKTQVPKSVVDQLDFTKSIDPHIFKNGVITVQPDKSALFNESLKTIEHAF